MTLFQSRPWRRLTFFVLVMLMIEFLDEFAYSALEAARPLIRDAFALSYVEVGLITTIPVLVAIVVEPLIGLIADSGRRRSLMVWGAVLFGLGLIIQGVSPTFGVFMIGATFQAPASGIFVNLAQASLMDDAPTRRENRMAMWTFSGSLAVVIGPLLLSGLLLLGSGWRLFFIVSGLLSIVVAAVIARLAANPAMRSTEEDDDTIDIKASLREIWQLNSRWDIWRWLILLQFSDLMLDVFFGLLALYMVDVVAVPQTQAALAIAVWTGVGLIGDFLLIPILERVDGLAYLRVSAAVELVLLPLFLLASNWWLILLLLGLMGLFNAGWYAILQGKVYDALGEKSGAVLIVGNLAGIFGALLPLGLGWAAQAFGLDSAIWFLLAGPIALVIGLPRQKVRE
ncbi:MAG: MFS transporter [Chloroflexi bacterium]|nr:MFS transporter [Chloroflexota bacterium]